MFFVLRTTLGGPREYLEYCYQEVVTVKDGVVVTQMTETAQQLQSSANFTLLGTAETEEAAWALVRPPQPAPEPETLVLPAVYPRPTFGAGGVPPKGAKKLPGKGKGEKGAALTPHVPWFGPDGVNLKPRQG